MSHFFAPEPQPFNLLNPFHIGTIALIVVLGWWLIHTARANVQVRQRLRYAIIASILLLQIGRYSWLLHYDLFSVQKHLPFHICSAMAWLSVYALWSRRRWAHRILYFLGVAGATQAVLTPAAMYGLAHFTYAETMASHGLVVLAGVWTAAVDGYRPIRRDPWIALLLAHAYAAVIFCLNLALSANYLFLMAKPESASLLDHFPAWPWYILFIEPLALAFVLLLALPFRRQKAMATL